MKEASKFFGACAARLTVTFFPLSFLMLSVYSKLDREVPRNSGSCAVTLSFAGKSLASVTSIGSCSAVAPPFTSTIRCWVPVGAPLGTSSRNSSETLELAAGMTAPIGWPPPMNVAVHPSGTPVTSSVKRCGATS